MRHPFCHLLQFFFQPIHRARLAKTELFHSSLMIPRETIHCNYTRYYVWNSRPFFLNPLTCQYQIISNNHVYVLFDILHFRLITYNATIWNIVTYSLTNRYEDFEITFEFHMNSFFRTRRKKFSKVLIFHSQMRYHQSCRLSQCSCTRIPRTHLRVSYQIENREKDSRNQHKILFARKFHSMELSCISFPSFIHTCV